MTTRKLFLRFPKSETEKPIIYHLVKDYGLIINIFRAQVTPEEGGYLVIEVTGDEERIAAAVAFIETFDITVDPVGKGLVWDESRCTACGNCIAHCPTHALYVADRLTMRVAFREELCIECLACLADCPFGACRSAF